MPLQFQQEVAVVTVVECEGTIGSAGDQCARKQFGPFVDRNYEIRLDAVVVSSKKIVAGLVIL